VKIIRRNFQLALSVKLPLRTPIYNDLFGENLEKRMQIVDFWQRNYLKRNKLIKQN
jgi:hypothetical protein